MQQTLMCHPHTPANRQSSLNRLDHADGCPAVQPAMHNRPENANCWDMCKRRWPQRHLSYNLGRPSEATSCSPLRACVQVAVLTGSDTVMPTVPLETQVSRLH
jgi:hypothetical protein